MKVLEQRLDGRKLLVQAQGKISRLLQCDDRFAYEVLRSIAMDCRSSVELTA
ncbi:ANTAR domain-containing protein [Pseudomonas viridiflava]|uniref:ANTAR domain-containing protein n=1 Tax=Pseudomonas viridiflava TaxID=33069 RepID=UPI0039B82229